MRSLVGLIFYFGHIGISLGSLPQISVNTSKAPDLQDFGTQVEATLIEWFPRVEKILNSPNYIPVLKISIDFDPDFKRVACTRSGGIIIASVDYYKSHRNDIGSLVHEMVHVIQGYSKCDRWVTEGIADWVRYFHYEKGRLNKIPGVKSHYSEGYSVAAYFLNYIEINYEGTIYWINKECREGTFDNGLFLRVTGKDVDVLWYEMMRDS